MKTYHKNPRTIKDKQFADLRAWLLELGDLSGIVHDLTSDEVISGNQRMRAIDVAKCEVQLTEGPHEPDAQGTVAHGYVLWQGAKYNYRQVRWTAEQCEKANIVANKAGGSWDFDVLANEWEKDDLLEWGFELEELGMLPDDETPEDPGAQIDKAEELREKWGVETGQLWQLGEHRLICGDCTDAAVVARVMGGERALIMVTDPPYGVEYDSNWRVEAGIQERSFNSGKVTNDDISDWTPAWRLFEGDVAYVWHAGVFSSIVQASLEICDFVIRAQIIWNKDLAVFGRGDYHWKHEPCWYTVRKGKSGNRTDDHTQATVWDIPTIHSFANGHNAEEWKLTGHGTQKPVECMERPIRNHKFDVVYDPFLGSGTTLIACERLSRRCRAIEISPAYCAVAIQRWVDMTGGTPELVVNSVETVQNAT